MALFRIVTVEQWVVEAEDQQTARDAVVNNVSFEITGYEPTKNSIFCGPADSDFWTKMDLGEAPSP